MDNSNLISECRVCGNREELRVRAFGVYSACINFCEPKLNHVHTAGEKCDQCSYLML